MQSKALYWRNITVMSWAFRGLVGTEKLVPFYTNNALEKDNGGPKNTRENVSRDAERK